MRKPTPEELATIAPIELAERRANLAHQRLTADLGLAVEALRIECGVPTEVMLDTATGEWVRVTTAQDGRRVREIIPTD